MDDLAGLIGCEPPLWKYFFFHPRIWLRMVYGATQATQFRLQGPGKKEFLARELMMKLPVSKPTHVVKAGLRWRVTYTFKALIPKFGFRRLFRRLTASST
jgi:dimethylaniline monooxygenase (N-oxide forming)